MRAEFELTAHLEDLEGLLNDLRIDRCLVLGWSLGGIVALELALRCPERVEGLILVGTAARPRGKHPPVTVMDYVYTGIAALLNQVKPGWSWNIEWFGRRSLFRYLIGQPTPQAYHYLAQEGVKAYWCTSRSAHRALNRAIARGYNRLGDLDKISCPVLGLAGEWDCHITADSSWETVQHLSRGQWRCYPQTAHLFPWEVSDQVLADIDYWLESQGFLHRSEGSGQHW